MRHIDYLIKYASGSDYSRLKLEELENTLDKYKRRARWAGATGALFAAARLSASGRALSDSQKQKLLPAALGLLALGYGAGHVAGRLWYKPEIDKLQEAIERRKTKSKRSKRIESGLLGEDMVSEF